MSSNRTLAALLSAVLLTASCAPVAQTATPDLIDNTNIAEPKINAKLTNVTSGNVTMLTSGGALVTPVNGTPVSFVISEDFSVPQATVVKYHARQGDLLQAGDPILTVEMDTQTILAQIAILEIDIAHARNDLTQTKQDRNTALLDYDTRAAAETHPDRKEILLLEKKIYELQTAGDVTRAQEDLERKEAQHTLYESLLSPYVMTAPVSGIFWDVLEVPVGSPISSGTQICTITSMDVYNITIKARSTALRLGMPVSMTLDGVTLNGVVGTEPYADGDFSIVTDEVFTIRPEAPLESPADYLTSVFPIQATFAAMTDVVILPEKTVRKDGSTSYVNVPFGSSMRRQVVKLGIYGNGNVHILQGLEDGDALYEGQ